MRIYRRFAVVGASAALGLAFALGQAPTERTWQAEHPYAVPAALPYAVPATLPYAVAATR